MNTTSCGAGSGVLHGVHGDGGPAGRVLPAGAGPHRLLARGGRVPPLLLTVPHRSHLRRRGQGNHFKKCLSNS